MAVFQKVRALTSVDIIANKRLTNDCCSWVCNPHQSCTCTPPRRGRAHLPAVARHPCHMISLSMGFTLIIRVRLTLIPLLSGYDPAPLAEQLSQHTPVPIPYKPPVDWSKWAVFAASSVLLHATLRFISPILQSRLTWAIGTVVTTLVMTSGYMFVRIRGAPYSGSNGQWIAAGYQNQYGQETQVVSLMCMYLLLVSWFHSNQTTSDGLLGAAFLMLTMVVPYQTSPKRQQAQIWLWTVVIFVMFSVLVSLFRVKNHGQSCIPVITG